MLITRPGGGYFGTPTNGFSAPSTTDVVGFLRKIRLWGPPKPVDDTGPGR